MADLAATLASLERDFLSLHQSKEALFWVTKMGTADDPEDAHRRMADAEIAMQRFLQDPDRLAELRALQARADGDDGQRRILRGWIALLAANAIESEEARALANRLVQMEGELERRRTEMPLGWRHPQSGEHVPASSVELALMLRTETDEANRRAAWEGLRSIERFVLDNGFLDIVRERNRLARMLGYDDFYAWRVDVVEGMSKKRLFGILDDLASRTAERSERELRALSAERGEAALAPWNLPYHRSGRVVRRLDPYFRFDRSFERWGRSFSALGIRYRGATLTLDLVDRSGKYENGFMHGPGLAFFDGGTWRPARINFTANAVPGQPGSGLRATQTLFHEGGHAAHFSNIVANAPCFSHEFAPTSVAYAETQSMFLESLLGDADWRLRYARDAEGRPIPQDLIELALAEQQPWRAWDLRARMTIPMAERAIYELPDDELTPDRVLETVRRVERELTGLEAAVRPVLAVPHLLAGESSAYYHAYILAEMAVEQTRRLFLERDGQLTDNPRLGPDLAEAYWAPGNQVAFEETLRRLTGSGLDPDPLVAECNLDTDRALARARRVMSRAEEQPAPQEPVQLDATIHVVHGRETVATTDRGGFEGAAEAFASWIRERERNAARARDDATDGDAAGARDA